MYLVMTGGAAMNEQIAAQIGTSGKMITFFYRGDHNGTPLYCHLAKEVDYAYIRLCL
ncbi:hypothetical protein J2Z49_001215 [Desulfofundulus luciae]|uniref:Uncharacterized protein n=1 Tax=Desulfofundulus luciae TaxID=74702 RepID=A0ABU0B078_9FIRM|nr:hypothetical protein [Desulfofundulus luciae]